MNRWLLILMAASLVFAADPGRGGQPMNDRERIQGTWRLVSGERNGKPFPEESVKNVTLVFSGDKLITKTKDRSTEARFKLNLDTEPKGIDLDLGEAVGLGIYRLDGDDLKIAHGEVGDPRPKDFPPKGGARLTFMVLKRDKP